MQNNNLSPVGKFFRNKWVWVIGALDLLLVIIIVVLLVNKTEETAVVSFNVAPIDATITINGSSDYKNIGQALDGNQNSGQFYSFKPGTYEIQISHDNLDTKTLVVELRPNSNTNVATFLSKDGDFYFYTLKANMNSFNRLASIASVDNNQTIDNDTSAEAFIARFQDDYNFMKNDLPIIDKAPSKYGIQYGVHFQYDYLKIQDGNGKVDCIKTLCLYITDTSGDKEEFALSVIRKFGYDPNDFQIVYRKVGYEE